MGSGWPPAMRSLAVMVTARGTPWRVMTCMACFGENAWLLYQVNNHRLAIVTISNLAHYQAKKGWHRP